MIELANHEEFVERLLRLTGGPFGSDAWEKVTDVVRREQSATADLAVGAKRVVRDFEAAAALRSVPTVEGGD